MKTIPKTIFALSALIALTACTNETVEEPFLRPVRSMVIESGVSEASHDFSGFW